MKRWIVAILNLAPGVLLIAVGISEIVSGYVPWLAARVGHAPIWLSVTCIAIGALGALPYLSVMYLQRCLRNLVALRRTNV